MISFFKEFFIKWSYSQRKRESKEVKEWIMLEIGENSKK